MTDRLALVTGASRGLGAAIAEQLALRGWHVVAVARTVGGLEDLDDRVRKAGLPGAGALTLAPMDVTNDDAMRHLCRQVFDRWGGAYTPQFTQLPSPRRATSTRRTGKSRLPPTPARPDC